MSYNRTHAAMGITPPKGWTPPKKRITSPNPNGSRLQQQRIAEHNTLVAQGLDGDPNGNNTIQD